MLCWQTKVDIIWKHLENGLSECFKIITTYHLHYVLFIFVRLVRFVVVISIVGVNDRVDSYIFFAIERSLQMGLGQFGCVWR